MSDFEDWVVAFLTVFTILALGFLPVLFIAIVITEWLS